MYGFIWMNYTRDMLRSCYTAQKFIFSSNNGLVKLVIFVLGQDFYNRMQPNISFNHPADDCSSFLIKKTFLPGSFIYTFRIYRRLYTIFFEFFL